MIRSILLIVLFCSSICQKTTAIPSEGTTIDPGKTKVPNGVSSNNPKGSITTVAVSNGAGTTIKPKAPGNTNAPKAKGSTSTEKPAGSNNPTKTTNSPLTTATTVPTTTIKPDPAKEACEGLGVIMHVFFSNKVFNSIYRRHDQGKLKL